MSFWKTILTKVSGGFYTNSTITENYTKIEDSIDSHLNRYPDDYTGTPDGNAMHTELDMNSNRIVNLTDLPQGNSEAANKLYVDNVALALTEDYTGLVNELDFKYTEAVAALHVRIDNVNLSGVTAVNALPLNPFVGASVFLLGQDKIKYYATEGWETVATLNDLANVAAPFRVDAGNNSTVLNKYQNEILTSGGVVKRVLNGGSYDGNPLTKKILDYTNYLEKPNDGYFILTRNLNSSDPNNKKTLIHDSINGLGSAVITSDNSSITNHAQTIISIDTDGFTLGSNPYVNEEGFEHVYMSFRTTNIIDGTDNTGNLYQIRNNLRTGVCFGKYRGAGNPGQLIPHKMQKVPQVVIIKNMTTDDKTAVFVHDKGFTNFTDASSSIGPNVSGILPRMDDETIPVGIFDDIETNRFNEEYVFYSFSEAPGNCYIGTFIGSPTYDISLDFGMDMRVPGAFMITKKSTDNEWFIIKQGGSGFIESYPLSGVEKPETRNIIFNATGAVITAPMFEVHSANVETLVIAFVPETNEADDTIDINGFKTTIADGLDADDFSTNNLLVDGLNSNLELIPNSTNYIYIDDNGSYGKTSIRPKLIDEDSSLYPTPTDIGASYPRNHYGYENISGFVAGSSELSSSTYPAFNAFNRVLPTPWASKSGDGVGAWLQYKLKEFPRTVRRFQWRTVSGTTFGKVEGFKIIGYDDAGTSYELLDVVSVIDSLGYSQVFDVVFPTPLKYYKFVVTQVEDNHTNCYIYDMFISFEDVVEGRDYYDYDNMIMRDWQDNEIRKTYIGEVVSDNSGSPISYTDYKEKITKLKDLELYGTINGMDVKDFNRSIPNTYGTWFEKNNIISLVEGYNVDVIFADSADDVITIVFEKPMESIEYIPVVYEGEGVSDRWHIFDKSLESFSLQFKNTSSNTIFPREGGFVVIGGRYRNAYL